MTTSTLSAFLRENKSKFLADVKADGAKSWTIVMGNEAGGKSISLSLSYLCTPELTTRRRLPIADLDSCASAIAYSYLTPLKPTIGLIQTPRQDLYLREENLAAFTLSQINIDDLLCINDILDITTPPQLNSSFALVDHNSLHKSFHRAEAKVVGIIDHHADEKAHLDASPRNIMVAGSCASLVAETFKDAFFQVSISHSDENGTEIETPAATPAPKELATLLLTAIYVDTGGLKPKGKAEAIDRAVAEILESYANHPADSLTGDPFRETTAKDLGVKKHKVDHLSSRDLLRRDYKEYSFVTVSGQPITVGLSTVPYGTKPWLARESSNGTLPGFRESLENWAKERRLDVVGILNTFKSANKGHKRRELLILIGGANTSPLSSLSTNEVANVEALSDALKNGLEEYKEFGLEGVKLKDEYEDIKGVPKEHAKNVLGVVHFWKQNNTEATRKAIAPAFKSIIEGPGSAMEGVKSTFAFGASENVNK